MANIKKYIIGETYMGLDFKQLINIDEKTLDYITKWMYDWWGKADGYNYQETKCYMKYSMQKDKLPKTYGLFLNDEIIGIYQFTNVNLIVRPDIYPWLANVYIDEKYRHKGYGRKLLETVKETAKDIKDCKEIFLWTEFKGLYEKFGWTFMGDIDTYSKESRIQRLYKLSL